MNKAKKFLVGLLAFASVSAFAFGMVACGEDGTDSGNLPPEGQNAIEQVYDSYVEYATAQGQTPLDYEAWLATIKGATGAQGIQGEQGVGIKTVYIENGHLFVILTEGDPIDCGPLPTDESNGSSNLSYIINEDGLGYTLTGIGLCSDREVVIPDAYKGKPVTAIGDNAFDARKSAGASLITSIVIPDSVTTIGDGAFYWCSNLTSVTIGNSVTTIGNSAFNGCSSLTSITIPDSVTTIGDGAFSGCSNLTSVYYTGDIESWCAIDFSYGGPLSKGADFYIDNEKVVDLVIPDGVETINDYAFYGANFESVTIGSSITTIGDSAFAYCDSLTNITIGNSVTTIESRAFSNCLSLTNVTIPDSVITIGTEGAWSEGRNHGAFFGCVNLRSVELGDSVTTIGDYTFSYCPKLQELVLGNSVETIGDCAFSDRDDSGMCVPYRYLMEIYNKSDIEIVSGEGFAKYTKNVYTNENEKGVFSTDEYGYETYTHGQNKYLFGYTGTESTLNIPGGITDIHQISVRNITGVTIPSSVHKIDADYISNLEYVRYTGNIAGWCAINFTGNSFGYGFDLYINNTKVVDLIIPNGVKTINDYAFYGCDSLTSVTIGNSVTTIGNMAFYGCTNLASVTIGNSVTTIGELAFYGCDSLASVTIGNSVTTIEDCAFYGCDSLTSVTIPISVTMIGMQAFYCYNNDISLVFEDTSTWYRTSNIENWKNKTGGYESDISTENSYGLNNNYWYKL